MGRSSAGLHSVESPPKIAHRCREKLRQKVKGAGQLGANVMSASFAFFANFSGDFRQFFCDFSQFS
jgi:hypothetical protein